MLNRSQLITLFGLCRRNKYLPYRDMRQLLGKIGSATFDSQSNIAKLLHHIAYGNLVAAKAMLDANPRLVLHAGHTKTPSGLKVLHTTPLECALGAGDQEMAKMIEPYFDSDKITGGATVREKQYDRYCMHIENMLKQKPYDFTLLIAVLKAAQPKDVTAALNHDMTYDSVLRDVLVQFRKDFTPGRVTSGMHFNYQHLVQAFEVYDQNYQDLLASSGDDYDKLRLFSYQIIGFIQRSLPAIDRMAFAQGLMDVFMIHAKIERSLKFKNEGIEIPAMIPRTFIFKYDSTDFPATGGDSSLSGLGYESFVHRSGGFYDKRDTACVCERGGVEFETYVEQKLNACRTYAAAARRKDASMSVAEITDVPCRLG